MDIEDLQATVTAGSCSSRLIFNVPKARSQASSSRSRPVPTTLRLRPSRRATRTRSCGSTLRDPGGNVLAGIQAGNRLPTVPELQAAAAANLPLGIGENWLGTVTGVYQHVGSRFTQIGDQAAGFGTVNMLTLPGVIGGPLTSGTFTFDPELPAYDIVNLRIGIASEKWDVASTSTTSPTSRRCWRSTRSAARAPGSASWSTSRVRSD
jgi:iron complex outermembrane recepter protein